MVARLNPIAREANIIQAGIFDRVETLVKEETKPRHDAEHWVAAADAILVLLAKPPFPIPCPEAQAPGLKVGRMLVEAVRPFTKSPSRIIYTEFERARIAAGEALVASNRRELDQAARTPSERAAAKKYGVGSVSPSSSPEVCAKALAQLVAGEENYPALWKLAQLDARDLAEVKEMSRKVTAIVESKKPRLAERKGKRIATMTSVLALEVWCDRVVAAARKRLPDGNALKGAIIEAARPENTRRRGTKGAAAAKKDPTK